MSYLSAFKCRIFCRFNLQTQGCTRCTVQQMHSASLCLVSHRHRIVKVHAANLSEQRKKLIDLRFSHVALPLFGILLGPPRLFWFLISLFVFHWNMCDILIMFISCLFNVPSISKLPISCAQVQENIVARELDIDTTGAVFQRLPGQICIPNLGGHLLRPKNRLKKCKAYGRLPTPKLQAKKCIKAYQRSVMVSLSPSSVSRDDLPSFQKLHLGTAWEQLGNRLHGNLLWGRNLKALD